MARKFLRKLMPEESRVQGNRVLRLFGATLLHRRLWQLNRHSASMGAASGVFWAWICAPIQTPAAAIMAWMGRGNVPLSMAFTWISNPLTWLPCFWLAYEVGLLITPATRIDGLSELIAEAMGAGPIQGFAVIGGFIFENLPRVYPMYVGGVVLGLISGGMTYGAISVLWRWHVGRRWRRRHRALHVTPDLVSPRPLSRGLAAVAVRMRSVRPRAGGGVQAT